MRLPTPQSGQVKTSQLPTQRPPEQLSSAAQLLGHVSVPPQPFGTDPHSVGVQLAVVRAMQQVPPEHAPPAQLFGQVIIPPQPSATMPHWVDVHVDTFFGSQHVLVAPHTPLMQSVAAVQVSIAAHFGQPAPPQSTSVSAPFFFLSVQVPTSPGVPPPPASAPESAPASAAPVGPPSRGIIGAGGVGALPNAPVEDDAAPECPPVPPVCEATAPP